MRSRDDFELSLTFVEKEDVRRVVGRVLDPLERGGYADRLTDKLMKYCESPRYTDWLVDDAGDLISAERAYLWMQSTPGSLQSMLDAPGGILRYLKTALETLDGSFMRANADNPSHHLPPLDITKTVAEIYIMILQLGNVNHRSRVAKKQKALGGGRQQFKRLVESSMESIRNALVKKLTGVCNDHAAQISSVLSAAAATTVNGVPLSTATTGLEFAGADSGASVKDFVDGMTFRLAREVDGEYLEQQVEGETADEMTPTWIPWWRRALLQIRRRRKRGCSFPFALALGRVLDVARSRTRLTRGGGSSL